MAVAANYRRNGGNGYAGEDIGNLFSLLLISYRKKGNARGGAVSPVPGNGYLRYRRTRPIIGAWALDTAHHEHPTTTPGGTVRTRAGQRNRLPEPKVAYPESSVEAAAPCLRGGTRALLWPSQSVTVSQLTQTATKGLNMSMTLADKVRAAYKAEVRRTGSYLAARQAVIARFKLSADRADRIIAADRERN